MQAVRFVAAWVFASGICSWRGCFFCHGGHFPQGQLYAAVFVVLGVLHPGMPFGLSRCFFLQAVFVPGGAVCFVRVCVAWVFFKKIGRFGFLFIVNFCLQNTISGQ